MRLIPFEYAVRNLGRSPSRLALTLSGSALVTLLVLIGGGFTRGMDRALTATGGLHNVILLGAGSEESVERSEISAGIPALVAASVPGIRVRAGVPFLSPEVHVMLPVGVDSARSSAQVTRQVVMRGVTPAAALVHDSVRLIEGRWPQAGYDEVIVGRLAATVLGVDESDLAIGKTLTLDRRPWTIVGRFTAPGTVVEAEVWAPLTDLMTATRRETISCVVLTLDPYDETTGQGAEFGDVDAFVKTRPDLELAAITERAYYAALARFFGPVRVVVWVTAGLIALGGLLGGLDTLYAAFASRVRELGTLQALGFRRLAILVSLVQESTLATAAGGLLACAAAALWLDGVAVRFSMGAFGLIVDERVTGMGLATGLVLGIVGALPPAIRCLRLPIPLALKSA